MKKLVAMSMIACMAMATVACGSSNSGDTAAAETTETTETADAAEDAEATDTADTSDKTWVIAMDTVFSPRRLSWGWTPPSRPWASPMRTTSSLVSM